MRSPALSLRGRLLALLLVATMLVWAGAALWSYQDARHEIGEMMDAQLAQAAEILQMQAGHELDEIDVDALASGHKYERRIAFQVWDRKGDLLLRSRSAPSTPLAAAGADFANVTLDGHAWRVFSRRDVASGMLVQVGERSELRDELATDTALNLLHPLLVALPVLALLIWFAIGKGLAPLDRLAVTVAGRAPEALTPLDTALAPREVQPLLAALNALFARVRDVLERERRFTADAAHELRTPLAAIKTHAQVAQQEIDAAARDRSLGHVIAGTDRSTRLVEQLLTLARIDPQGTLPVIADVDLSAVVAATLAEVGPLAAAKRIELALIGSPGATVAGDATMLEMLVRNLADNALRYTPEGGEVTVRVDAGPTDAVLEIADSGPGIDMSERARVFERFYRVSGTGENGSGLGLSIVKRIVELHGARIALGDREPGTGLRVTVRFPARATPE